jgi:hypothetical protein
VIRTHLGLEMLARRFEAAAERADDGLVVQSQNPASGAAEGRSARGRIP